MAAFTFVSDFVVINDRGTNTANWSAFGGGASGLAVQTDFYYEGSTCISKQVKQEFKGMGFATGSIPVTDNHYVWVYTTTKQAMYERTLDGGDNVAGLFFRVTFSGPATNFIPIDGRNNPDLDGWYCAVYSPLASEALKAGATPVLETDFVTGLGAMVNNEFSVRGVNFGVDVAWAGTYFGGYGGGGGDPDITFSDIAAVTEDPNQRYGMFQSNGSVYQLLAILNIGESGQTTLFSDTGSSIVIPLRNYPEIINSTTTTSVISRIVSSTCSQVVVAGGSGTTAVFTRTIFKSLDPQNTGRFSTTAGAVVTLNDCVFSQWGTVTPGGNTANFNGCKFIELEVGVINSGGGLFNDCIFTDCPPMQTSLSDVTGSTFSTDGTNGHAIETDVTGGTVSLTDNSFVGYNVADGQADSAIHFTATSGSVTVNLSGGVQPSILSDGISVTFASSSTLTLTGLIDGSEVRVYEAGTVTELAGVESTSGGTFITGISVSAVDIVIHHIDYIHQRLANVDTTTNRSIPIEYQVDRQYANP
jgi:hypothetical protein